MQHLNGVDGVIVDLVEEVTEAISDWIRPAEEREEDKDSFLGEEGKMQVKTKPEFLHQRQLSLPLKLPPELLHT